MKLTNQQIGKCGELIVQYKLLSHGIESAPLTTDAGIDLVAFSSKKSTALTIQVKTNQKPKPGGGKGKLLIDWWIPEKSPANIFAFVELEKERVWLVEAKLLPKLAQQNPEGKYHFYMYTDPTSKPRKDGLQSNDYEFERYLLENLVHNFF